jgi:hypothetical protein
MSVNPYESSRVPAPQAVQPLELPVRIEHEATLEDHVEFNLCYQRSIGVSQVLRLAVPVVGMIAVLGMLLMAVVQLVTSPQGADFDNVAALFSATVVAIVMVPLLIALIWFDPMKWIATPVYRWLISRGDTTPLFGPHVLTITAEHLIEQGPKADHRFAISSLQKIVLAPRHIFLFVSTLQGIIIPRRALTSEQEADALVELLERLTRAKVVRG